MKRIILSLTALCFAACTAQHLFRPTGSRRAGKRTAGHYRHHAFLAPCPGPTKKVDLNAPHWTTRYTAYTNGTGALGAAAP